jgi:hypothetical protein
VVPGNLDLGCDFSVQSTGSVVGDMALLASADLLGHVAQHLLVVGGRPVRGDGGGRQPWFPRKAFLEDRFPENVDREGLLLPATWHAVDISS